MNLKIASRFFGTFGIATLIFKKVDFQFSIRFDFIGIPGEAQDSIRPPTVPGTLRSLGREIYQSFACRIYTSQIPSNIFKGGINCE